jgi:hypothetical protein
MAILLGCGRVLLGNQPFCDQFPVLIDLCQSQDGIIKNCVDSNFLIPFRRRLRGELLTQWNSIVEKIRYVPLSSVGDKIYWALNKNSIFSIKSVYAWLERNLAGSHNGWIWKAIRCP